MLRAMQNGVHVKNFFYHREEDAIRKTLCQNTTDFALGADDSEQVWIPCGANQPRGPSRRLMPLRVPATFPRTKSQLR
jgi:hypothetical protein